MTGFFYFWASWPPQWPTESKFYKIFFPEFAKWQMNEIFPYFPHSTRHALVTFGQNSKLGERRTLDIHLAKSDKISYIQVFLKKLLSVKRKFSFYSSRGLTRKQSNRITEFDIEPWMINSHLPTTLDSLLLHMVRIWTGEGGLQRILIRFQSSVSSYYYNLQCVCFCYNVRVYNVWLSLCFLHIDKQASSQFNEAPEKV